MSLTSLIHKRLLDLLDEKRVVVWYDGEKAFGDLATAFRAPNCTVISAATSRLRARREADEALTQLNDPEFPAEKRNANLLIYAPWPRGKTDGERRADPFEGFALIGASFGDKPAEQFPSLARQAMPQRINEIDRLFREGKPNLQLIEGLSEAVKFPLVDQSLGTDSAVEVAALLLCRDGVTTKFKETPGADKELLRLLQNNFGFAPPHGVSSVDAVLDHFGRYALFSEFVFDLPTDIPEGLATVPRAGLEHKERIFALCDRMRGADDTRENYIALAQRVEQELRLIESTRELKGFGVRDTFPFEEKFQLTLLGELAQEEKLEATKELIEDRRRSVWHHVAERAVLWKVAERCIDLLVAIHNGMARIPNVEDSVRVWIAAYTSADGFWQVDRCQRLMEQSAAECAEDKEVDELVALCRQRYFQTIEIAQSRFLKVIEREGWPPEDVLRQTQIFDRYVGSRLNERRRTAFFLVDALRYEMGRDVARAVESLGSVTAAHSTTVVPTTTTCGMAALMPGADGGYSLESDGDDLTPAIAGKLLRGSAERMSLLKERFGDRFQEMRLDELLSMSHKKFQAAIRSADLVVIRTQDIDSLGEGQSIYRARKVMSEIIGELRTAADRLIANGIEVVVFAADHGHVLLPDVAPGDVLQLPPGEWKKTKRRCLLGSSLGSIPGVRILPAAKMGIVGPVAEIAVATGFRVFSAGESYFHEGISLQECIVPVVVLEAGGPSAARGGGEEIAIRYRNDYFSSRVIGVKVWFNALLREKMTIRLEAYDGTGPKAKVVGEAADCDARDPATGLVTLEKGKETQVPIRIRDDFDGRSVQIRASDPSTGVALHTISLKNSLLD